MVLLGAAPVHAAAKKKGKSSREDFFDQETPGACSTKAMPPAACHEAGAKGDGRYPKLAQQHPDYTLLQLQRFASGERFNDKGRVMRNVASRLSAEEMAALAEYLAAP